MDNRWRLFWRGWRLGLALVAFDIILGNRVVPRIQIVLIFMALIMLAYCHYYLKKHKGEGLVTGGPYRYIRHPIYTGFILIDLLLLWPVPPLTDLFFYVGQALFIPGIVICAYLEEIAAIERYGATAKEYYARTPGLLPYFSFHNKNGGS